LEDFERLSEANCLMTFDMSDRKKQPQSCDGEKKWFTYARATGVAAYP
jgi:hypothetical protein